VVLFLPSATDSIPPEFQCNSQKLKKIRKIKEFTPSGLIENISPLNEGFTSSGTSKLVHYF
jgi:hypothetical protein